MCCLGPGAHAAEVRLSGIEVTSAAGQVVTEITASAELSYTTLRLDRPRRFVVDLPGVVPGPVPAAIEVGEGPVRRIRVGQFQTAPRPICRLVFDLESAAEPEIEARGTRLTVRFAAVAASSAPEPAPLVEVPPVTPPPAPEPPVSPAPLPPPPPAEPPPPTEPEPTEPVPTEPMPTEAGPAPRATVLRGLDLRCEDSTAVLRVAANGWLAYSSYRLADPERLVVELQGVGSDHPTGPIPSYRGPVTGVQVIPLAGNSVRLLMGLASAADHRVESVPDGLVVTVTSLAPAAPQPATASAPQSATAPEPVAAAAPEPAADESPPAAVWPPEHVDHDSLLAGALPDYPSLHITGFGEVNYSDSDDEARPQGFSEGQLVLHLSSALSPRISFFGEVALTARDDEFEVSVERGVLRYDHSDRLKVSLGRYHTPISWWNTAYHHGAWLHSTIGRPAMVAFGGVFLPLHFVGGMVEGTFPAGGVNLGYRAGLGNGRGEDPRRPGDAGDANSSLAWLVNLRVRPDRLFGLEAGGAYYVDRISPEGGPELDERIASAYVVWQRYQGELIGEYAEVRHLPSAGEADDFTSRAFYLQAGYRLPWAGERLVPYYRYESMEIADGDSVFSAVPELSGSTFGLRLDFTQFAALKAEYRLFRRPGQPEESGGFAQVAFTF